MLLHTCCLPRWDCSWPGQLFTIAVGVGGWGGGNSPGGKRYIGNPDVLYRIPWIVSSLPLFPIFKVCFSPNSARGPCITPPPPPPPHSCHEEILEEDEHPVRKVRGPHGQELVHGLKEELTVDSLGKEEFTRGRE